jgi:hypothetical protein
MKIEFERVKEKKEYWVYTGEISKPVDFVGITSVWVSEIECCSATDEYNPGPLADFAFFDNELEAIEYAAIKLNQSLKENDITLKALRAILEKEEL